MAQYRKLGGRFSKKLCALVPDDQNIHEVPADYVPDLNAGIEFYKKGFNREMIVETVSKCIETGGSFDEELVIVTATGRDKWVRAMGQAKELMARQ